MAIIFSGNTKLRDNEYGVYFMGLDCNLYEAPSIFDRWLIKIGIAKLPIINNISQNSIWVNYDADHSFDSLKSLVSFAENYKAYNIALPCPEVTLTEAINFKHLLDNIDTEVNIRVIIPLNILRKINEVNNQRISSYINENYQENKIQYSIGITLEDLKKETQKKKADADKQKLSFEELLQNLEKEPIKLEKSFSNMLFDLIKEKNMNEVEVYKRANLDRRHFSKIRNNSEYKPSKETALSLCIALKLNLEETDKLLNTIGISLSNSSLLDVVVKAFIVNEIYDLDQLNLCLLEKNLKPLTYY